MPPRKDVINPFQTSELRVPKAQWEAVRKLTSTFRTEGGEQSDPDRTPFRRYVDLWWAAMCIGVRIGQPTKVAEWHKVIEGTILLSDPWRILHLQALAIAHHGDAEIVRDPTAVINLANEFAATGLPLIVDAVRNPASDPIWLAGDFLGGRTFSAIQ
jgi:hypothetical protein